MVKVFFLKFYKIIGYPSACKSRKPKIDDDIQFSTALEDTQKSVFESQQIDLPRGISIDVTFRGERAV